MKNEIIQIEKIEAKFLPELQGWKDKQELLVKENPFIEIIDNKTYIQAKSRRTALVTGRTTIQNQDKTIAAKLKEFRSRTIEAAKELISISLPHEEKQQLEVKRWEKIKADEKAEKERLEAERVEKIKKNIDSIYNSWRKEISELKYSDLESFLMESELEKTDLGQFEEFQYNFLKAKEELKQLLSDKIISLETAEKQRVEDERLRIEREEFEEQKRIQAEKEEVERKEAKKKQAKIDADNKAKEDALKMEREKLDEEKRIIDQEKAEKRVKEEAEQKAKEEAEAKKKEQKRIKALAPDKEKISAFIESLNFQSETPIIKDKKLKEFLSNTINHIENLKESMINKVSNIK